MDLTPKSMLAKGSFWAIKTRTQLRIGDGPHRERNRRTEDKNVGSWPYLEAEWLTDGGKFEDAIAHAAVKIDQRPVELQGS